MAYSSEFNRKLYNKNKIVYKKCKTYHSNQEWEFNFFLVDNKYFYHLQVNNTKLYKYTLNI